MTKPQVGSLVTVRLARMQGGASKVSPDHPSYRTYPEVRCRIAQVAVCGVPGIFALEYLDGKPVGLPFSEEDFLGVVPGRCVAESPLTNGRDSFGWAL